MSLVHLTEKQKNKEVRSVQKDLRSKDEAVKFSALKKISDNLEYYRESGIVKAVFEGVVAKKVCFY
jgi:hypothetical protein